MLVNEPSCLENLIRRDPCLVKLAIVLSGAKSAYLIFAVLAFLYTLLVVVVSGERSLIFDRIRKFETIFPSTVGAEIRVAYRRNLPILKVLSHLS